MLGVGVPRSRAGESGVPGAADVGRGSRVGAEASLSSRVRGEVVRGSQVEREIAGMGVPNGRGRDLGWKSGLRREGSRVGGGCGGPLGVEVPTSLPVAPRGRERRPPPAGTRG